jgi:SAM-dependent methyltransferase
MTAPAAPLSERRLAELDRYLAARAAELFEHDDRVRGLRVRAEFRGGVAHLSGDVDTPGQVDAARRLVGTLGGVLAVWSRVRVAGREPVQVDLGCGEQRQYPGSFGVDRRAAPGVAVVADLSAGLPFRDRSVDTIFAVHILEHLIDFLVLVDECHRVLRPGGVLHVLSPWWRYVNAVADPTHVRLLDVQTIKGICRRLGSPLRWYPRHAGCDGASVFADLTPLAPGDPDPDPAQLARFFD